MMADAYPELAAERETIARWVGDEEESFGRTLERGTELLEQLVEEAKAQETSWIDAEDAFKLHDTYGFPFDLTKELLAERGLAVDDGGFEELMEEQRERARTGAATAHGSEDHHERVIAFASEADRDPVRRLRDAAGDDRGRCRRRRERRGAGQARGEPVLRRGRRPGRRLRACSAGTGERRGSPTSTGSARTRRSRSRPRSAESGTAIEALVDHEARHATMRNHTATHLLHAALRERLGDHVRQAGSAVRPDKLRFDFTHGKALAAEDIAAIEDRVNELDQGEPPGPLAGDGARRGRALGAMALFGEKYGEWVRVVEVDGVSRELCGGTHVANTAEIGIFKIASEGSSAANVRRIEALSGPAAIDWFREREDSLREVGELLGTPQDPLAAARRAAEQLREAGEGARQAAKQQLGERGRAARRRGRRRSAGWRFSRPAPRSPTRRRCSTSPTGSRRKLGEETAIVLGGAEGEKVALVALVSKPAVARGVSAADVVGEAAPVVGGGGGGRDGDGPGRRPRSREARRRAGAPPARRSSGHWGSDAGPRPRPRHRPHRLRPLRPERDAGDAAAGDRAAEPAGGRRARRRVRGRGVVVGLPLHLNGERGDPGGADPDLLRRTRGDARDPGRDLRRAADDADGRGEQARGRGRRRRLARRRPPARRPTSPAQEATAGDEADDE